MKTLMRFVRDERGTESVEWALILGVIILAAVLAAIGAKPLITSIFTDMVDALSTAAGA